MPAEQQFYLYKTLHKNLFSVLVHFLQLWDDEIPQLDVGVLQVVVDDDDVKVPIGLSVLYLRCRRSQSLMEGII